MAEEVAWFCEENNLNSEVEFDLNLAMEELFINALRHGGCEGLKEAVRIRLERVENRVDAEFSDRGCEFDPATVPPPEFEPTLADRALGGLGLHLARRAMGDLSWRRSEGWNHVSMRRVV
jgi:anti-sigma regulatory factor (Ser/Thr protein kinase)